MNHLIAISEMSRLMIDLQGILDDQDKNIGMEIKYLQ